MNSQTLKGKNNKSGQMAVSCCGSVVDGVSCGSAATVRGRYYWIGPFGGYGALGGRVCDWHQKSLKLMSFFEFFTVVICFTYI